MSLKVVFFCCLFGLVTASTEEQPEVSLSSGGVNRIVGGWDARRGEFPHQVSLQTVRLGSLRHICGGSIVNEYWILTAAHCVMPRLYVKAGILRLQPAESTRQVSAVLKKVVHPDHNNPRLANDIALLKLDEPLEFNKYVQPIRLPKQDEPVGGQVTLSGWGATDEYGYDVSNTLQKVDLPIIGNQRCKYRLTRLTGRLASVVSSNVCTGPLTGGTSACAGDSGGPLIKYENGKPTLVGVVSWGLSPCALATSTSVYTRVASFVDWIESTVSQN